MTHTLYILESTIVLFSLITKVRHTPLNVNTLRTFVVLGVSPNSSPNI